MRSLTEKRCSFPTADPLLAIASWHVDKPTIVAGLLSVLCLMVAFTASTCLAQSGVLENYATMRSGVSGALWQGQTDTGAGSVTACSLGVNQMICVPQPQGSGPVPNGIGFWLITLD